jgi:hypothetical protein
MDFFTMSSGTLASRLAIASTGAATFSNSVTASSFISTTANGSYLRASNYTWMGGSGGDYGSVGYNQGYTTTTTTYNYVFSDFSSILRFDSGGFNFLTAPNGTAGNAITFTPRMIITNAGNVLIGTTSIAANYGSPKLLVVGGSNPLTLTNGDDTGTYLQFNLGSAGGVVNLQADARTGDYPPLTFTTGATERMRITSNGTIGLNGSADVNNGAGIDKLSIGYLNSNYGWIQTWNATSLYLNKIGNAVYAGTQRIDNNSDARLKDNIESVKDALSIVLSLNGRKYNMKDENGKLRYGFVAQEVEPYLADFVTHSDRTFEKDNVKIQNLLTLESSGAAWGALLVEAIKELKAEVDQLRAK